MSCYGFYFIIDFNYLLKNLNIKISISGQQPWGKLSTISAFPAISSTILAEYVSTENDGMVGFQHSRQFRQIHQNCKSVGN